VGYWKLGRGQGKGKSRPDTCVEKTEVDGDSVKKGGYRGEIREQKNGISGGMGGMGMFYGSRRDLGISL